MSNPLRGEVTLTGESGATYKIRLGTNALARMQETFGEKSIKGLLNRLSSELSGGDFDVIQLRHIVQASSVVEISEEDAGNLLDDCGIVTTLQAIAESLNGALGISKSPRKGSTKRKPTRSIDSSETLPKSA